MRYETTIKVTSIKKSKLQVKDAYLIRLLDLANFRKLVRSEAKRSQLLGDFHSIATYPISTFGRL